MELGLLFLPGNLEETFLHPLGRTVRQYVAKRLVTLSHCLASASKAHIANWC